MKSKNVDITILKSDVYHKVRRHSSYLGGKDIYTGNASDYDRISAAEADKVMLDQLWEKVFPLLVAQVQRYLFGSEQVSKNATGAKLTLTMPMAFNVTNNKPLLEDEFAAYLSTAILIKWLEIANADNDVKQLTEEMKDHTIAIKDILARRDMPVRPVFDLPTGADITFDSE